MAKACRCHAERALGIADRRIDAERNDQRHVGVLHGVHDPRIGFGERGKDRVGTCDHLGAGRAVPDENLAPRIVQPAAVAPNHRHREPHRATLTPTCRAAGK